MYAADTSRALAALLREIVEGIEPGGGGYVLNSGDVGLLRSLAKITADEASRSTNGGATIAAHAQHVRYGLSLMNRWARVKAAIRSPTRSGTRRGRSQP
jgi:vacuolar-type H+-ATPase subunit E/Vma4